jgi:hypothetical protein
MTSSTPVLDTWRANRDAKLRPVLPDGEPVWLLEESQDFQKEMMLFSVITRWYKSDWIRRRYFYDPVGNVLHFRGERTLTHEERAKLKPSEQYRPIPP